MILSMGPFQVDLPHLVVSSGMWSILWVLPDHEICLVKYCAILVVVKNPKRK